MEKIKPLFTIGATAVGGRNGHTETSDGLVKADLSLPKAAGGLANPTRVLLNISLQQAMRLVLAAHLTE